MSTTPHDAIAQMIAGLYQSFDVEVIGPCTLHRAPQFDTLLIVADTGERRMFRLTITLDDHEHEWTRTPTGDISRQAYCTVPTCDITRSHYQADQR